MCFVFKFFNKAKTFVPICIEKKQKKLKQSDVYEQLNNFQNVFSIMGTMYKK